MNQRAFTFRSIFFGLAIAITSGSVTAASLLGHVTDDGEDLEDVEVKLINESDGVILLTKYTDSSGLVTFRVKPGIYSLAAFKDDYSSAWYRNLKIGTQKHAVNIEMSPEAFAEENVSESEDCD